MKKAIWLVVPIVLFLWGVSAAEFYRYTDPDGHVRYTDDLSKVPVDQRPNIKSYEESESTEAPPAADTATPASTAEKKPAPRHNDTIDAQAEQIRELESELNNEYKDLMNEKSRLEEARKKAIRKIDVDRVNREISELNDKIYQWEQKRNAYNKKLDAYNARVTEEAKKRQSK